MQNGRIEESMWTKIIEKMYEEQDALVLQDNIRQIIQRRAAAVSNQNPLTNQYATVQSQRSTTKQDAAIYQTAKKLTREELVKDVIAANKSSQQLLYSDF